MCGIAGILTTNKYQDSLETLITRMQTALRHRGPDDKGIYISSERQVAIAHTRLSILDLSPAGHQPMSVADGRYWITFNGEIYNYLQLRQDLISQGEEFYSHTDTEVILKLYEKYGSDCVTHLRGMFAFAIWDNWENTCFIARDPLGIKPLYYWQSGSDLVFASELRAILASGLPAVNMSPQGLYGYLISGSVPEPYTLIENVRCLGAGHFLHWSPDGIKQQQYWQINFAPEKISVPEATEKVRTALLDSIKHHFVSDVPVGIFLSSGIDSTTLLALASQTQTQAIHTYSIGFAENKWNEADSAKQIANLFGSKHTEYKITALEAKELFPEFLRAIDQPSIDGFNTFCVSQLAHNNGTKVVLSGLGGDELFAGYKSFETVPQMVTKAKYLQKIPFLNTSAGTALAYWGNSPKFKRLGDFLQHSSLASPAAYRSFRGTFSHVEAGQIFKQYLPEQNIPSFSSLIPELSGHFPTLEDEVSFLELNCYMRNQLLRDSDVMSMNWGLELRVPFVDQTLLETVASIPSDIRLNYGKKLLIQSVPELPDLVLNRPKRGFFFPYEEWMNKEWQDYFQNISGAKNIPLQPWYRRWSLAILQNWWQQIA
ncbi:MAG: asparagine synthase (glutamine-hydrolyzing) [Cyanobacteria bacterium P01_A01_bin.84]